MTRALLIQLMAFGGGGFALGLAHFATLRANARLYLEAGPIWRPLALNLFRLGMTGAVFAAAVALGGATPALAGLAGFFIARSVLVRAAWGGV
jgi:hypothetical protein